MFWVAFYPWKVSEEIKNWCTFQTFKFVQKLFFYHIRNIFWLLDNPLFHLVWKSIRNLDLNNVRIPPLFWGGIGKYPISVQRNWVAIPPEVRSTKEGITAQFRGTLIGYFPIPPQTKGGIHIVIQKMIVPSLSIWMSFVHKSMWKNPLNLQRGRGYWILPPTPLHHWQRGGW